MRWLVLGLMGVLVASFQVIVPNKNVLALRGHSTILRCEFTPDVDLRTLVVTWQREEDSQVIHSFYYERDQLNRQSPQYVNRTSLYNTELYKGNASIRITAIRAKDAGRYLCIVSNAKGTGRALVEVTYGALYVEPRLSIHVNASAVTLHFETKGFPKPEVGWFGEVGQSLHHHLELHEQTEEGLYVVQSRCVAQKQHFNVTFTLKNQLLNQNMQRLVVFSNDEDSTNYNIVIVVLSLVCTFLLVCVICLTAWMKRIRSSIATNHY